MMLLSSTVSNSLGPDMDTDSQGTLIETRYTYISIGYIVEEMPT